MLSLRTLQCPISIQCLYTLVLCASTALLFTTRSFLACFVLPWIEGGDNWRTVHPRGNEQTNKSPIISRDSRATHNTHPVQFPTFTFYECRCRPPLTHQPHTPVQLYIVLVYSARTLRKCQASLLVPQYASLKLTHPWPSAANPGAPRRSTCAGGGRPASLCSPAPPL